MPPHPPFDGSFKTKCLFIRLNHGPCSVDSRVMLGIQAPKADKKLPIYMRLSELKKFLSFLKTHEHPYALRNELIFKLLATSGMRRSELVGLTWVQIDLESNTILKLTNTFILVAFTNQNFLLK